MFAFIIDLSQSLSSHITFLSQDGGNTVSRALLVWNTNLTLQSLTGTASLQIPRRLRRQRGPASVVARVHLFSLGTTFEKLKYNLATDMDHICSMQQGPLEAYEGVIDGLCAMACHPNINVRGNAIGTGELVFGNVKARCVLSFMPTSFIMYYSYHTAEYAFTRYGWVIKPRIPRLLSAFALREDGQGVKFGILSTNSLVDVVNAQGKRSRLAEAIKGVIKLLGA